jgi:hypothetical protein
VDLTPYEDGEFVKRPGDTFWLASAVSPSRDGVDLLTVVSHELGHALGFDHLAGTGSSRELMSPTLETGERRPPPPSR